MKNYLNIISIAVLGAALSACSDSSDNTNSGGNTGGASGQTAPKAFNINSISLSNGRTFLATWDESEGATSYTLCKKDSSLPDECTVLKTTSSPSLSFTPYGVLQNLTATYFIRAENSAGSMRSNEVTLSPAQVAQLVYYIKASNSGNDDMFGQSVSISANNDVLVVGANAEDSNSIGINGDGSDNSNGNAGAAYIYRHNGTTWVQEAFVKASNSEANDEFGWSVNISGDGNTIAVGARNEDSNSAANETDNSAAFSGAAYVFRYDGTNWAQQAYVKASLPDAGDRFGHSVSLSSDGNTLAVGAPFESSDANTINGDETNNTATYSGAAYLYRFDGSNWTQQAYIKANNSGSSDNFGNSVALSADGNTLAVGAFYEESNATGINGNGSDNSSGDSGAAYVFRYDGSAWNQQAYIKASNTEVSARFAYSLSISDSGNVLAVGSPSKSGTGAAYVFRFNGTDWLEEQFISSANSDINDEFGFSIAISPDGNTLAVGALNEDSNATNINGDETDNSSSASGSVYVYAYDGSAWNQTAYVKAPNSDPIDQFGNAVALGSQEVIAVGATREQSIATGVDGDQSDNTGANVGAVYIY